MKGKSNVFWKIVGRPLSLVGIASPCVLGILVGCDGGAAVTKATPAGSSPVATQDDHDHAAPATFADAVKQLVSIRDTIKSAFAKNDAEAAHGPLHDVGHVLEAMNKLMDAASLDEKQKETAKTSVELLFANYGKVDSLMHGDKGEKYEDVAVKIDEAVKALEGLVAPKP